LLVREYQEATALLRSVGKKFTEDLNIKATQKDIRDALSSIRKK